MEAIAEKTDLRDRFSLTPELVVFVGEEVAAVSAGIRTVLEDDRLRLPGFLKWISYHSQKRFQKFEGKRNVRAAVTAYGGTELEKELVQLEKMVRERPEEGFAFPSAGLFYGRGDPVGKLGFLFPGQGSQYVGMGGEVAAAYPMAERVWEKLGEMRFKGKKIREIVFPPKPEGEEEAFLQLLQLASADWTNACISVAGEALFKLLSSMGVRPDAVAAHSWGDVSAYRSAGILTDEDMVRVAQHRGDIGVNCPTATSGCILIVNETVEKIKELVSKNEIQQVWIANYNAPSQNVLAGIKEEILRTKEIFDAEAIRSFLIPISAAVHCPLASQGAHVFEKYLEQIDFGKASCELYSYLLGRKVDNDPELFKRILWVQAEKPVKFMGQIEQMYEDGIRTFVEVGPSDVLTRFVGMILGEKPHAAITMDKRKEDSNLFFLLAVAELAAAGRIQNFEALWDGYRAPPAPPVETPDGNKEAALALEACPFTSLCPFQEELRKISGGCSCPSSGQEEDTDPKELEANRLRKLDMEFAKIDHIRSS